MKKTILLPLLLIGIIYPALAQKTIAVLPYKISYEGRIPKKYTPEDIAENQLQDGRNYQASMINSLSRLSYKRSNLPLDVTVLGQMELEGLIASKKLTIEQLDSMTDKQIADTLGVTHIVRGTAIRTFIMSDEMSLGITAVSILTNQQLMNATSNINIINSLEEVNGDGTIFSRQFMRTTSATRSDDQSLRDAFRKSSRRMFKIMKKSA
jgi:hypothetical protein